MYSFNTHYVIFIIIIIIVSGVEPYEKYGELEFGSRYLNENIFCITTRSAVGPA
jgi:hypothetical protein